MEISNVFNVVSEEEMVCFGVYLKRVLATDEAKSVLLEAKGFAEAAGNYASADMIQTVLSEGISELDDWDAVELAAWLFAQGNGQIEIA